MNRSTGAALQRRRDGFLDSRQHPPLHRKRIPLNARPRRRPMSAAAELRRHLIHVHRVALGAEADPRHRRPHFFKDAGHDHRLDGANMVNQPLGVAAVGPGAGEVPVLQPELGDLVVVSQVEMIIDVLEQTDAREGEGLVNLVADRFQVRAPISPIRRRCDRSPAWWWDIGTSRCRWKRP